MKYKLFIAKEYLTMLFWDTLVGLINGKYTLYRKESKTILKLLKITQKPKK